MSLCHSDHQCPLDCALKYVDRNSNEVLLRGMLCTSPVIDHIYHNNHLPVMRLPKPHAFRNRDMEKLKEISSVSTSKTD